MLIKVDKSKSKLNISIYIKQVYNYITCHSFFKIIISEKNEFKRFKFLQEHHTKAFKLKVSKECLKAF